MVRPRRRLRASCLFASLGTVLVLTGVSVRPAHGQDLPPASEIQAPAHIAVVDGVAVLERDGEIDDAPSNMPLLAGDRVRTRGGRVEILFADGSTLHLDHYSTIDLQSDDLVRLIEGRIRLSIPGPSRAVAYRIDGPHGWANIAEPGEYRVALLKTPAGSELELAVIRGRAELANDGGRTPLRAGERAFARAAAAPSYAFVANSAAWDAFDRWSEARRDERLVASAQYLPDEVRPYAAALDRHGYWREEPAYGRVWYPRVEPDWRPYYRGRWTNLRPYGWTWVAHDPWGWPTHHYGRWGFSSGAWFWIPGRTWGAAWVSWASAPGYVSWCPLGWDNRPVLQININVGRQYDPWRAWTVLPERHFGRGSVHRNVVGIHGVDAQARSAFRVAQRAPLPAGYAVPRASMPIRVAGTSPGRRASAPLYTNLPADRGRMRTDGARVRVPTGTAVPRVTTGPRPDLTRERTIPAAPALRAERPGGLGPDDRPARPRPGAVQPARPWDRPREMTPPAGERTQPGAPRYQPSPGRSAVRREAPREDAPARVEPPMRQRPFQRPRPGAAQPPRDDGHDEGLRTAAPGRQARPRADPRPPSVQPPPASQGPRRGPDGPPSGAYERRSPAAAQPPAPPPAGRPPAAAPAGARPRPSGGGGTPAAAPAGARPRPAGGGR